MVISKMESQLTKLEALADEMEELVEEIRCIDAKIEVERGFVIDIETSVGFSPEKVLHVARFEIMRARETLAHLDQPHTFRWFKSQQKKDATDIPVMVQSQTRTLQRSIRTLNELKDTLNDVFR